MESNIVQQRVPINSDPGHWVHVSDSPRHVRVPRRRRVRKCNCRTLCRSRKRNPRAGSRVSRNWSRWRPKSATC